MRRFIWGMAAILALGIARLHATEGGGGAYPNGAENFMAGALPPPGLYLINYDEYYQANSFRDNTGNSLYPGFDLNVFAEVVRLVNVTPITVFGGNWAQHVFFPFVYMNATVEPVPGVQFRDHKFGMGDIIVDPFIVGWHKPPFHWTIGLDTYIPSGRYEESDVANIGRNYWTFEPVFGATYLNDGGQEVSAKLMYDFNTVNEATDVRSGQEFHTDFIAAQHRGPFAAGFGGYWYVQTTDDDQNGRLASSRGRVLALGPCASYQAGPVILSLSWDHEMLVEERPRGDAVWFKLILPLGEPPKAAK